MSDRCVEVYSAHVNITKIVEKKRKCSYDNESFFIFNITEVIKKCILWKTSLPRVTPFYAVKCNDNYDVLKVLASLGIGFDCASKCEIDQVLHHDVEPNRIIFAHTIKPEAYITHATNVGVTLMTFDNEEELKKMKTFCSDVKAVLRIKCDSTKAIINYGKKFGCDVNTEALTLLKLAYTLNVEVVGVSFHVGSLCDDPQAFVLGIKLARSVFDMADQYGFKMSLLDIGGGYYGTREDIFKQCATAINSAIDKHFFNLSVKIIAEPGTFFVQSAFTLACNITSKKKTLNNMIYYINNGIHGSFNFHYIYGYPLIVYPLIKHLDEQLYTSTIFGATCTSIDTLSETLILPEMKVGEWLVFENMGAYTLPLNTSFNGFPIPKFLNVMDSWSWCFLKDKFLNYRCINCEYGDNETEGANKLNLDKHHYTMFTIANTKS